MTGLHTHIDPSYGPSVPDENLVIGVIVHKTYGDIPLVEKTVRRGADAHPEAIWARQDTDTITRNIYDALGLDHVVIPLNPYWKGETYDFRRVMRDFEMLRCDHLLVFQNASASSDWKTRLARNCHLCLRVIEHGEEKRRGRKVAA